MLSTKGNQRLLLTASTVSNPCLETDSQLIQPPRPSAPLPSAPTARTIFITQYLELLLGWRCRHGDTGRRMAPSPRRCIHSVQTVARGAPMMTMQLPRTAPTAALISPLALGKSHDETWRELDTWMANFGGREICTKGKENSMPFPHPSLVPGCAYAPVDAGPKGRLRQGPLDILLLAPPQIRPHRSLLLFSTPTHDSASSPTQLFRRIPSLWAPAFSGQSLAPTSFRGH